jgi:hypothetical protein
LVDDAFYRDSIEADESGDMGGRMLRVEIEMDRKIPEGEEKEKNDPGTRSRFFQDHEEDPEAKKNQKGKEQALKGEGRVEMARVDSQGIGN